LKSGLPLLAEIDGVLRRPGRILIASDFDGTLCHLVDRPEDAALAPSALTSVRQIFACRRLTFAVITGRGVSDVARRLPPGVILAGNHGLEIAAADFSFEHEGARQMRPVIARACEALDGAVARWPGAWVEDKDLTATLHFRKVATSYRETLLYTARRILGVFGPRVAMRAGRDALEIRPRVAWDKGAALGYIYERTGPFDSCICLGDDRTDESMFRAECCDVGVLVGRSRHTAAAWHLPQPINVAHLLSHIAAICGGDLPSMGAGVSASGH
jgi:trehalose 6-phosphate phosphatase